MDELTFLEQIKVDQQETVMANILAYFFTSGKPHGLGSIFIEALLRTEFRDLDVHSKKYNYSEDELPKVFDGVEVDTEVGTDEQKRIDILIKNQEFVVCIEFKINHVLNNNLQSYKKRVLKHHAGKKQFYIILTPTWKKPEFPPKKESEYKCDDFKQVMLNDFIGKVEELKEKRNIKLDEKQNYYYEDFVQTIKNRREIIELYNKYSSDDSIPPKDRIKLEKFIEGKCRSLYEYIGKRGIKFYKKPNELESVIEKTSGEGRSKKVRLTLAGWQTEEWLNQEKKIIEKLPLDTSFEELKMFL